MSGLSGLNVLITRPEHQADALCRALTQQGAQTCHIPMLDIVPLARPESIHNLHNIHQYHSAIATSTNAVLHAHRLVPESITQAAQWFAPGAKTQAALRAHGATQVHAPSPHFNSEALLALPGLQQLAQQKILLVCGENSRPLLATTLQQRGAQVEHASVYRRVCPDHAARLNAQFKHHAPDVITITSLEALDNLITLAAQQRLTIQHVPLVTPSGRMVKRASELGFHTCIAAANASDEALLTALLTWYQRRPT